MCILYTTRQLKSHSIIDEYAAETTLIVSEKYLIDKTHIFNIYLRISFTLICITSLVLFTLFPMYDEFGSISVHQKIYYTKK